MTAKKYARLAVVDGGIAERLHALFAGYEHAHGTHGEPTRKPDTVKWEIKSTAATRDGPSTVALWEQHLAGKRPLGVVPIRADGRCSWASIDYDVYDADIIKIIRSSASLPLVPCRSKSGGLHLFAFFAEPQPASEVRSVLRAMAERLDMIGSEIFPKQDSIDPERDSGNWMCMPYLGTTFDGRLKEQVGLKKNVNEMTVQEFLSTAERARISPEDFAALPRWNGRGAGAPHAPRDAGAPPSDPSEPFGDGPPCLQTLAAQKVPSGVQNKALLNMGIYYKRKYPDGWQDHLKLANSEYLDPEGTLDAENLGDANGQVDRCCCLCLSGRDVGAGHVARAASSTGWHNHAGRTRMRTL